MILYILFLVFLGTGTAEAVRILLDYEYGIPFLVVCFVGLPLIYLCREKIRMDANYIAFGICVGVFVDIWIRLFFLTT